MKSESELCVDQLLSYVSELNQSLDKIKTSKSDDDIKEAKDRIQQCRNFIARNVTIIPSHTLKTANDSLRKLDSLIEKPQRCEFKFISKPQDNEPKSSDQEIKDNPTKSDSCNLICDNFYGFRNQTNQDLCFNDGQADNRDISLIDLESCRVTVLGLANTVHLRNLKDCSVIIFLATRAVTLTNCINCELKIVCQQLRINSTKMTTFQLYTSARTMLEESSNLTFQCLDMNQMDKLIDEPRRSDLLAKAKFEVHKNNWKCIDDFDWLHATIPSKNYTILMNNSEQ